MIRVEQVRRLGDDYVLKEVGEFELSGRHEHDVICAILRSSPDGTVRTTYPHGVTLQYSIVTDYIDVPRRRKRLLRRAFA